MHRTTHTYIYGSYPLFFGYPSSVTCVASHPFIVVVFHNTQTGGSLHECLSAGRGDNFSQWPSSLPTHIDKVKQIGPLSSRYQAHDRSSFSRNEAYLRTEIKLTLSHRRFPSTNDIVKNICCNYSHILYEPCNGLQIYKRNGRGNNMGATPSRETVSMFSYFRGSYEVGLFPLTSHFFGKPDTHPGPGAPESSGCWSGGESDCSPHRPDAHGHAGTASTATAPRSAQNRAQLRAQLCQMRQDPAVVYANARDAKNIDRAIQRFLEEHEAVYAAKRAKRKVEVAAAAAPIRGSPQGVVHRKDCDSGGDETQSHHYRRNPCAEEAKATTGPSTSLTHGTIETDDPHPSDNAAVATATDTSDGKSDEEEWLEELLLSVERDVEGNFILTDRIREELWWDVMPECTFTEDDLDAFLACVDQHLYDTDEDMIRDERYAGERDTYYASQSPAAHTTGTAAPPPSRPAFCIPIPCALCLAYPEGNERDGCFLLDGRNINLIGFFGLMTSEMERAFQLVKRTPLPGADHQHSREASNDNTTTPHSLMCANDHQSSPPTAGPPTCQLHFNTAILASAGDRTLERVLVLAAVMLRQQFHAAMRSFIVNTKTAATLAHRRLCYSTLHTATPTSSGLADASSPSLPTPVTASSGIQLSMSLPTFKETAENCATNPSLGFALPPLPSGMFTPYTCPTNSNFLHPLQIQLQHAAHFFRNPEEVHHTLANNAPPHAAFCSSSQRSCSHSQTDVPPNGIPAAPPSGLADLSPAEEDSISWALFRRLETISVDIEAASNNYASLKSFTENFAFLHCQVHIDPSDATLELQLLPDPLPASPADEAMRESSKSLAVPSSRKATNAVDGSLHGTTATAQDAVSGDMLTGKPLDGRLHPNAGVHISLKPRYVRQATLWASCLFHNPTPLPGGQWVQYKLKDECYLIRHIVQNKDLLIAHWRQHDVAHSSNYLGPNTTRLTAHVRGLQDVVERARALPPSHWDGKRVDVNQDGRKYALQRSPYGTMLIGVRTRGNTSNGSATAASGIALKAGDHVPKSGGINRPLPEDHHGKLTTMQVSGGIIRSHKEGGSSKGKKLLYDRSAQHRLGMAMTHPGHTPSPGNYAMYSTYAAIPPPHPVRDMSYAVLSYAQQQQQQLMTLNLAATTAAATGNSAPVLLTVCPYMQADPHTQVSQPAFLPLPSESLMAPAAAPTVLVPPAQPPSPTTHTAFPLYLQTFAPNAEQQLPQWHLSRHISPPQQQTLYYETKLQPQQARLMQPMMLSAMPIDAVMGAVHSNNANMYPAFQPAAAMHANATHSSLTDCSDVSWTAVPVAANTNPGTAFYTTVDRKPALVQTTAAAAPVAQANCLNMESQTTGPYHAPASMTWGAPTGLTYLCGGRGTFVDDSTPLERRTQAGGSLTGAGMPSPFGAP